MGIERLIMTLSKEAVEIPNNNYYDLYIGAIGEEAYKASFKLANDLRVKGSKVEINHMGRSLKAEMKFANKIGAKYTLILGEDELTSKNVKLKRMSDGEIFEVSLNEIDKLIETMK
jgi:histidyl-tRNA synthetase